MSPHKHSDIVTCHTHGKDDGKKTFQRIYLINPSTEPVKMERRLIVTNKTIILNLAFEIYQIF